MSSQSDLRSLIHQHRIFFDELVELVPAKFYINNEDRQNSTWHYGMSKAARAAAKQTTKDHLKKARRERLDPDKFTSTLKILEQQEMAGSKNVEDDESHASQTAFKGKTNRAVTYEELQERLHKRIEMLRANRHADAAVATANNAVSWRNQKKKDYQKQKEQQSEKQVEPNGDMPHVKRPRHDLDNASKKGLSEVTGFDFGKVKMESDGANLGRKHKRHKTKGQLLAKAENLHLETQDPEKGQGVALKHSWSAAVSRAAGEKVFDDPKLLKRSLKKEQQQRQKSAQKWKERKETEKKLGEEKQQTRSEHIRQRIEQKREQKHAKRDKKLLRPGFEGRKEGFINE